MVASEPVWLEGPEAIVAAAAALVSAANRRLDIYAPTLEPALFADDSLVAAIRALALGHERAAVRVLVAQGGATLHDAKPLLQLLQRLPSRISLRVLEQDCPRDRPELRQRFLVADEHSALQQNDPLIPRARLALAAPGRARVLLDLFEPLWIRAESDPEVRQIGI